jgi:Tricorn protease C1 domain
MRSFRGLSHAILVGVMALGVLRLDIGALAQVEALPATPPLIEEVSRLVSKHFYDRETVERVWAQARAAHTAALPPDATSAEVAAALDAMLDELGASHTEHYLPGELAYYELLDVFARDEFAARLRRLFPKASTPGKHSDLQLAPRAAPAAGARGSRGLEPPQPRTEIIP